MTQEANNRDLVLAPNEYSLISDISKGNIGVYVGPHKTSLANTDKPVVFDGKQFLESSLIGSIQLFPSAREGYYIVLENPAIDKKQPTQGAHNLVALQYGSKINITGPNTFALWPGQKAEVVKGHHLRSNQYLVTRVYNEEAASKNWDTAVIKPQKGSDKSEKPPEKPSQLVMGQLLNIKGTDTSFYIPPTGIEVVKENNNYVRDAVSLENLEYCILLDQGGEKRFVYGPCVVFPKPTETFIEKDGRRKFRVIELNELMGIYIKVVAPYKEGDKQIKAGEEFFITGKDTKLYFPRAEHAIIRYGDQIIQYAIAIPEGESRYVLDKNTGKILLVKGPIMYLPDPRRYVIVKRLLDKKEVALWYPGNKEALLINQNLNEENIKSRGIPIAAKNITAAFSMSDYSNISFAGEGLERKTEYTPPRSITLDTKYEGAPLINVWPGYAIQITSKSNKRKVVTGPAIVMLEYDETLDYLELSTGTPKSNNDTIRTVYLQICNNKVSDCLQVETIDLVKLNLYLSYKINFEEPHDKWFNVNNYVQLLCDHMQSTLRKVVKKHTIENFYANAIDIIRSIIVNKEDKKVGRLFSENNMRLYDIELLNCEVADNEIKEQFIEAQRTTIEQTLKAIQKEQLLKVTERKEKAIQEISALETATLIKDKEHEITKINKELEVDLSNINKTIKSGETQIKYEAARQIHLNTINKEQIKRKDEADKQELLIEQQKLAQILEKLKAETSAIQEKAKAISPQLISALQAFSDKALVGQVAESMAPLSILGGKSIAEVLNKLLKGTKLENILTNKENN